MKILYHHRIASKDGQYVHVEELTNAFIELGHELYFVAPEFTRRTDFGDSGGIASRLKRVLPRPVYEIIELSYSLVIAVKLMIAILRFKPDFIYERYNLYQPAGVIIARLSGIPIVLEVNAPLVDEREEYSGLSLTRLARFIENFTWRKADLVLPVTAVLAKLVEKAGVESEKVHVIHNGVNEKLLDKEFRIKECFATDKIVVGFVGFINPWHRLDLAIDAIADHRDKNIQLVCIGEGSIRSDLVNQAKQLGIENKIIFTGLLDRTEVFDYIRRFDVALQPSVTAYASPLKLFEYMAASCVVIAPRTDNICEIVSDQNSVLFELGDVEDFSLKLTDVIENIEMFSDKRLLARQAILTHGFTWQDNARKVVELISKI